MKHLKKIAVSALAMAAFAVPLGAGSASATTLEIAGATQNKSVWVPLRLAPFSSTVLSRTDGSLANTCTTSRYSGSTVAPFTGTKVTGWVISFTFEGCTRPVTVHWAGEFYIQHIAGTTDGTMFSENAEVTVGSPFGTLNCKTGGGTHLGTLTGKGWGGWSTLHVSAVLNCGFLMPSASWKGTYELEHGEGLGVSA